MTTKIKVKRLSNKVVYFLYILFIMIFVIIGQVFFNKKIVDKVLVTFNYLESGTTNYRVFYKENPFYTEPYLESGKSYVTQYVDYIDVNFDYYRNYSSIINGSYQTNIKATLIVYEPGNIENDYWKKTYNIETGDKKDVLGKDYHIIKNIKVDYNQYLNDYQEYKSSSVISHDAKLIVEMIVNNNAKYKDLSPINNKSILTINIPLSEASFKITTNENLAKDTVNYDKKEYNEKAKKIALFIAITAWIVVLILSILFIIRYRKDLDKQSLFERKLKKILTSYGSVLVECKKMPYVGDISVVFVSSFEELVDAQNEVRLPINYKVSKGKQTATFILIRNNLAWVYQLRGATLNEKD